MQPIFTMQYAEFMVADHLKKKIEKISVFIPTSAQEKGIDLMLYHFDEERKQNTICTVQVKMSRIYYNKASNKYPYTAWFNQFQVQSNADWYILTGIYAKLPMEEYSSKSGAAKWDSIMLVFTNQEMTKFISELQQKKDPQKPDQMFAFGFNNEKKIYQTRGYGDTRNMDHHLIDNRIKEIENSFR